MSKFNSEKTLKYVFYFVNLMLTLCYFAKNDPIEIKIFCVLGQHF